MNNVNCHRDMTEILLKAALNTIQSINKFLRVLKGSDCVIESSLGII